MATLNDIARRANVSYMTVARVLSRQNKENRPSSIARAQHIRRVAQEMGYRPNAAARAVTQGRFNTILLVLSREESSGSFPASLSCAIQDSLASRRCRLTLAHYSNDSLADEARMNHLLGEVFADGMLIDMSHHVSQSLLLMMQKLRLPTICVNINRRHDAVRTDDFQGGVVATEHLLAQGHKKIAYLDILNHPQAITLGDSHDSVRDRYAGYLEAMKKAGLVPQAFFTKKTLSALPLGELPTEAILAPDGPTAVVSYGQEGLIRLYTLAEARRRQIRLVTFGETPRTLNGEIPIETAIMPTTRLAETAVDMLFQKINHPDLHLTSVTVPYEKVMPFIAPVKHDGQNATARSLLTCEVPTAKSPGTGANTQVNNVRIQRSVVPIFRKAQ